MRSCQYDYVRQFEERESWSPEDMHSYVAARLQSLLLWSYTTVPYYRDRWRAAGLEAGDLSRMELSDLVKIPITPKEDVRSNPTNLVSTSLPPRRRLLKHLTSGSTGTPPTIYLTSATYRQFMAAREARSFRWANVSIRQPRSMIGSRLIVPPDASDGPAYRYNIIEHQLYMSAHHLSREHLPSYIEGLNHYRPQVLTGFAHSHYLLAQMILEAGAELQYQPQAAILVSDKATGAMKHTMLQAFGARAYEEYGSVENCVLATECSEGNLHVHPDFGIVQIVDESGNHTDPGEIGRLVCTGLINTAQPLVRYAIGDMGAWSTKTCPCGRESMPVLEGIVGRDNDVIMMRDGRRLTTAAALIFTGARGVVEGQVVQEDFEDFTIRVVATTDFGQEQVEYLKKGLQRRLGDVRAKVEVVDSLERTSTGKFKSVVNRMTQRT